MTQSKTALDALADAVKTALAASDATIQFIRNPEGDLRVDQNGCVVMVDGDSGQPVEESLSPPLAWYEHQVEFEIAVAQGQPDPRNARADQIAILLGQALAAAQATALNGAVARLMWTPAQINLDAPQGTTAERRLLVIAMLTYALNPFNPLT
jgi:hypothetical protein